VQFQCFSSHSQFPIFFEGRLSIPIGRFSSKFFGKRRKRRRELMQGDFRRILSQFSENLAICEDTGVFKRVIVLIATQFAENNATIVCDHLAICCIQSTLSACCLNALNFSHGFSLCSMRNEAFNFADSHSLSICGVQQQPRMLSISEARKSSQFAADDDALNLLNRNVLSIVMQTVELCKQFTWAMRLSEFTGRSEVYSEDVTVLMKRSLIGLDAERCSQSLSICCGKDCSQFEAKMTLSNLTAEDALNFTHGEGSQFSMKRMLSIFGAEEALNLDLGEGSQFAVQMMLSIRVGGRGLNCLSLFLIFSFDPPLLPPPRTQIQSRQRVLKLRKL
jgi:hypothetical protein